MSNCTKTIIAKSKYKTEVLYNKFRTHFDVAKHYMRDDHFSGKSLDDILYDDCYRGNYYWSVSTRSCGDVSPGKIKIELKDKGEKIFDIRDVYKQMKLELTQLTLFS